MIRTFRKWMSGFGKKASDEAPQQTSSETPGSAATIDSDAPVRASQDDRFDRAPFAFRIAETLVRRTDPASLVIAIYGAWGDGKTTVLNFIREKLERESSVVCVNFNPWRLNGEDELLRGFFSTLADALDAELKTNTEKIGEALKEYSFFLKPVPVLSKLEDVAKGTGSLMSAVTLDKLRTKISSILRESRKRVVVIIDDIDRLEKAEIQSVFRLVKLTADFDFVAYVLAFDEAMVAAAIGERFSSDQEKSEVAGANFLEKIVQVGLHLPPTGAEELQSYAFEQVDEALRVSSTELSRDEVTEFILHFRGGIVPHLRTPRMAKKYGNALQFALGILRNEIRYVDLMLLEAIRTFYPKLYLALRERKTTLLNGDREFDLTAFIREQSPTSTDNEIAGLARIVQGLFPRTSSTTYPSDWNLQWSKARRVCATYYFDRYFTYAIRANDVSDSGIDELLKLDGVDDDTYVLALLKLYTSKNAAVFISKLRDREDELTANAARRITMAVAAISESLPTSSSMLDALSRPLVQGASFVSRALNRIPEGERLELVRQVFTTSNSPLFISACMMVMSTSSEERLREQTRIFTPEQEAEIQRLGAERIISQLEQSGEPLLAVDVEDVGNLMNTLQWGLGREETRQHVTRWVEAQPRSAIRVIRAYKGKGTNIQSGLPIETPFFRQMYNSMVTFVDADVLITALTTVYGDNLNETGSPIEDDDLRLAKQFIAMHKQIVEAQQEQASGSLDS
jgi:KAP family P-loop domain